MMKIDESKLTNAESVLTAKYGAPGTAPRKAFEEKAQAYYYGVILRDRRKELKAQAYYYGVILRDRRKELKMTQVELAQKVGTARSYIARIEKGETDIQLSSFLRIAHALKMEFSPVYL